VFNHYCSLSLFVIIPFAVADFWALFFANFQEKKKIPDRATGEHAYFIETQRGKDIFDDASEILAEHRAVLELRENLVEEADKAALGGIARDAAESAVMSAEYG
jgi:hypothetical protein